MLSKSKFLLPSPLPSMAVLTPFTRAYNSGHQIASHTWSHKDLTGQAASGIQTEVTRLETALKKILGIKPKWLRPPYGGQNSNVLSTLRGYNYKVVTWNLDSEDWNGMFTAFYVIIDTQQLLAPIFRCQRRVLSVKVQRPRCRSPYHPPRTRCSPVNRTATRPLDRSVGQLEGPPCRHSFGMLRREHSWRPVRDGRRCHSEG